MNNQDSTTSGPVILALDTSSRITSLAVRWGQKLLRSTAAPADEKRSEKLWSDVRTLLAEVDMTLNDVDVFAVCVGPGSFTGLRVGMAAAKGFSSATQKSIVGVTSLETAAFGARPAQFVCSMVSAYRGEVYSQLFSFAADGVPAPQNDPIISTFEKALERVASVKGLALAGDGINADVVDAMNNNQQQGEERWAVRPLQKNLAEDVASLALAKSVRGEVDSSASLKACYVRPAEAEIKLSMGLLGSKIKRSMKRE